jgi:hypothetical protein
VYKLPVPGNSMSESPKWWQNYYDYHTKYYPLTYFSFLLEARGQYLTHCHNLAEDYILFETEEDATAFILRWS